MDARVLAAAANNARWCDLVCRSHELSTVTSEERWVALEASPRFYPDAVTLAPGLTADAVLSGIGDRPGCSVKDSFADVELAGRGFVVLFEASWLFAEAAAAPRRPRLDWRTVTTPGDFDGWVSSADLEGVLRPTLVDDAMVHVLAAGREQPWAAGAVAHVTDGVVGVSNVFAAGVALDAVWSDLPAVVGQTVGDLPLVGYARGDALRAAVAGGFSAVGALRVWSKPSP